MKHGAILLGVMVMVLAGAGVVGAAALNDLPQDAQPVQDVTADLNRQSAEQARAAVEAARAPAEEAPEAAPAPARPVAIVPPTLDIPTGSLDDEKIEEAATEPTGTPVVPSTPARRQRGRVAIVEAVDKVTAYRMRFEVPVGGRPVRFQKSLIFTAKACEMSAPDEQVEDSIAYMEVNVQPRGLLNAETRQVFRGWMFSSTPAVSGLQHPTYDAWVVGCKA